jgi:DNA-binding LacI/PurR family transcriptional regulator
MPSSRTTIKDIARECGVSLSTVSLVLNNNPRISPTTREKVLAAVARHQYQPNVFARSLASRSSRALSVVVPHLNHVFSDVYFGEVVSGIYERASELGYKVLLDVADLRFVRSREYLSLLKSRRVDGLLFIGSSVHDTYLLEMEKADYPFLLVNHHFPGVQLNTVQVDYVAAARLAAEHLLRLGHRRIGLLLGTNTHTGQDFHRAFVAICRDGGVREADLPWADGSFTESGGHLAAQWLLERRGDLTALMCANDKMALGALRHLLKRGQRVPADVSIMGVDDLPTAQFTVPGLSTIRLDLYQLGARSVDNALALFRKEQVSCREILPISVVVRESTGPARAG